MPGNWCWVRLGGAIELISGRDVALSECNDRGVGIPYILGASNINNGTFKAERWIESPQVISRKNDILLSVKGTIGKLYIQQEDSINISRQIMAIRPYKKINLTFVYYFLQYICNELREAGNGLIPGISRSDILKKVFMLPPLAEQQRIVDRIESLFARLDEAKEKAQAVLDGFELRKSAILYKAFSGELTERWREEHGVGLDSWHKTVFKNILDVRDGTHDSPQYHDKGLALVTSKNLKNGGITNKDVKFISKEDYDKINERSKVDIGDVLFAMIGTIGNPVVVEQEPNYAIKNIALFKNIGKVNPYMIKYYLETKELRDKMNKEAKGSTQRFVSLRYLRNLPITIPIETEQEQMVEILDNLLFKELQAKEAAESVLEQIDTMKKSILARAFHGKLGTNEPEEASAVELPREKEEFIG